MVALIPRLRRYARALTGNADQADDLVQDCMERAWSKLHLWRPDSNMQAWLFTIMHNLHANRRRSAHSRGQMVVLPDWGDEITVQPVQEQVVEFRAVAAALYRLPEEQRQVLLLVALEGFGYREVAEMLGIPIGTVMSRLSRGRERLRDLCVGADAASRQFGRENHE